MSKFFTTVLLFFTLVLSACNATSASQAENAGKAMAETACLLFDENVSLSDIESKTKDIMGKYGFTSAEEIDTYLATIRETSEIDMVSEVTRKQLESLCSDSLSASGVSAADLAKAMVRAE